MLEAHIMQAQAAAMAADERELQRISEGYENYQALGLPPGNRTWRKTCRWHYCPYTVVCTLISTVLNFKFIAFMLQVFALFPCNIVDQRKIS